MARLLPGPLTVCCDCGHMIDNNAHQPVRCKRCTNATISATTTAATTKNQQLQQRSMLQHSRRLQQRQELATSNNHTTTHVKKRTRQVPMRTTSNQGLCDMLPHLQIHTRSEARTTMRGGKQDAMQHYHSEGRQAIATLDARGLVLTPSR